MGPRCFRWLACLSRWVLLTKKPVEGLAAPLPAFVERRCCPSVAANHREPVVRENVEGGRGDGRIIEELSHLGAGHAGHLRELLLSIQPPQAVRLRADEERAVVRGRQRGERVGGQPRHLDGVLLRAAQDGHLPQSEVAAGQVVAAVLRLLEAAPVVLLRQAVHRAHVAVELFRGDGLLGPVPVHQVRRGRHHRHVPVIADEHVPALADAQRVGVAGPLCLADDVAVLVQLVLEPHRVPVAVVLQALDAGDAVVGADVDVPPLRAPGHLGAGEHRAVLVEVVIIGVADADVLRPVGGRGLLQVLFQHDGAVGGDPHHVHVALLVLAVAHRVKPGGIRVVVPGMRASIRAVDEGAAWDVLGGVAHVGPARAAAANDGGARGQRVRAEALARLADVAHPSGLRVTRPQHADARAVEQPDVLGIVHAHRQHAPEVVALGVVDLWVGGPRARASLGGGRGLGRARVRVAGRAGIRVAGRARIRVAGRARIRGPRRARVRAVRRSRIRGFLIHVVWGGRHGLRASTCPRRDHHHHRTRPQQSANHRCRLLDQGGPRASAIPARDRGICGQGHRGWEGFFPETAGPASQRGKRARMRTAAWRDGAAQALLQGALRARGAQLHRDGVIPVQLELRPHLRPLGQRVRLHLLAIEPHRRLVAHVELRGRQALARDGHLIVRALRDDPLEIEGPHGLEGALVRVMAGDVLGGLADLRPHLGGVDALVRVPFGVLDGAAGLLREHLGGVAGLLVLGLLLGLDLLSCVARECRGSHANDQCCDELLHSRIS
ncbi:hypothetical protein STIAU_0556 [Stigmatella aurantiaca DW4/3-1]|uniref:Uncharacterized protein n=1 Tax=Stigmatella aurantiaca (strain DW4/3-1) TaxID=378806 RepID=Q091P7_STIAD|nr:hypothetical protein STIAU_0556 [Stigmatella aurantiaca DW4/3-1]